MNVEYTQIELKMREIKQTLTYLNGIILYVEHPS